VDRREERDVTAGMELLVLGAGPAYSDIPGSCGASYLLQARGEALLLDLGQGSFPALARAIEPSSLRAVIISHLHPDHFIDLIPLRHYLCRAEFAPGRRVRVIAPAGLDERLDGAYATPGFAAAAFDLEAGADGPLPAGAFELRSVRVTHAGESRAWRVGLAREDTPGLVYSGDAGSIDEIAPLVQPGDTILAEASHGPDPVPPGMNHLNSPLVAALATRTRAGAVIATHVRMGTDLDATVATIRAGYAGPVGLANPGARFPIAGPKP
jgi:ribonuclease BN (tRNA processing enzyme)